MFIKNILTFIHFLLLFAWLMMMMMISKWFFRFFYWKFLLKIGIIVDGIHLVGCNWRTLSLLFFLFFDSTKVNISPIISIIIIIGWLKQNYACHSIDVIIIIIIIRFNGQSIFDWLTGFIEFLFFYVFNKSNFKIEKKIFGKI